jgi:hypothetical protein
MNAARWLIQSQSFPFQGCIRQVATGKSLRIQRTAAVVLALFSLLILASGIRLNLVVVLLSFVALLGSLIWLLVILVLLRKSPSVASPRAGILWRVAFLVAFAAFSAYYHGSGDWRQSWGYLLTVVLCLTAAVLLWKRSPLAKYPLYAETIFFVIGSLGGGVYNYLHYPAVRATPIKSQIIMWLIPIMLAVPLINCCLFVRRFARPAQS